MTLGMHAKHVIVDDIATYIGSQNLYNCNNAEWGIIVDSEEETKTLLKEYWIPMWDNSWGPEYTDAAVQAESDQVKETQKVLCALLN